MNCMGTRLNEKLISGSLLKPNQPMGNRFSSPVHTHAGFIHSRGTAKWKQLFQRAIPSHAQLPCIFPLGQFFSHQVIFLFSTWLKTKGTHPFSKIEDNQQPPECMFYCGRETQYVNDRTSRRKHRQINHLPRSPCRDLRNILWFPPSSIQIAIRLDFWCL